MLIRMVLRRAGLCLVAAALASPLALASAANTWVLSNRKYEPLNFVQQPIVGNGYLGLRIPAIGEGYQGGNLGQSGFPLYNDRYTSTLVAGVYENTGTTDYIASLPTWSEMDLEVDGHTLNAYVPPSQVSNYRQSVDMRTATVTTSMTWTPSPGKDIAIQYTVLANRARMHLGEVKLTFTPSWSGSLALNAFLNGEGARRIKPVSRTVDTSTGMSETVLQTPGRNTMVAETQLLIAGSGVTVSARSAIQPAHNKSTVGIKWVIPVVAGRTYQIIKYAGISTSNDSKTPEAAAAHAVLAAAHDGWPSLLAAHQAAWAKLWAAGVSVPHQEGLQTAVHSAFYLLYSSIRAGLAWSIPPAGLTSDNYGGEIFWDADTWMLPTLLTFHPALAKPIVDFRYDTKAAAEGNAARAGYKGAMWAWDNGPTGTCGGLAPCSHYEDHLQSDIALAQWQYYEATGNREWLAERGYPVIKDVADFWVSRVKLGSDGKYHIDDVTGPDEFTAHVNDESMTNASAIVALRDAVAAAEAIGQKPNPRWTKIAANIYVAVAPDGSHPEYVGYTNQTVKQADTVLMTYPFGYVTSRAAAALDLDRYMAVTDPGGPAMTASVEGIIAAQIQEPGCLAYTLLQDAYLPFLRGAYDQFLETQYLFPSAHQGHPAFDFATGAGGFLQMFPFGFAGLRWSASGLTLAPTLPPQLHAGITLRHIRYQGRSLTVAIGPRITTVTLDSGAPVMLHVNGGVRTLSLHHPVELQTSRPDLKPTNNLARCQPVTASSAARASQPAAAVDGNSVTRWLATSSASSFEISLKDRAQRGDSIVKTSGATIHWGASRPADFTALVETAAGQWKQVAAGPISGSGASPIHWAAIPSRTIRFSFRGGSAASITEVDVPAVKKAKSKTLNKNP